MGAAPANGMARADRLAAMDARMKTLREMHARMMNAKTAGERLALSADHMKAMQGGMALMKGMSGMGGMGDPNGTPADMAQRHKMMTQHMEMMQRMPPTAGQQ